MQIFRFMTSDGISILLYGSRGLTQTGISRSSGPARISSMTLAPGGEIGEHTATAAQLFLVISGSGWVTGGEGRPTPLSAGEGAFWEQGEQHGANTDTGLSAIVIEADGLTPGVQLKAAV